MEIMRSVESDHMPIGPNTIVLPLDAIVLVSEIHSENWPDGFPVSGDNIAKIKSVL